MGKLSRTLREAVSHVTNLENELDSSQAENKELIERLNVLSNALAFAMAKLDMSLDELLNAYNLTKNGIEPFDSFEDMPSFEDMQQYKTTDVEGLADSQKSGYYYHEGLKMSGL